MEALLPNLRELLASIEDCLKKERILSCLVLLYCGIDVLAGLERTAREGTRVAFVRWVDRYVLNSGLLRCTALELYAARCGIVHSFRADSDLSRRGRVRTVVYAWGTASAEDLAEVAATIQRSDIAVHLNDLVESFRRGIATYLEELENDPVRRRIVESRAAGYWFMHLRQDVLGKYLEILRRAPKK